MLISKSNDVMYMSDIVNINDLKQINFNLFSYWSDLIIKFKIYCILMLHI